MFISSFYMAKRNPKDLDQLKLAIDSTNTKNKQHILCGDFNCPDVDLNNLSLKNASNFQDKPIQQQRVDLSIETNLTQVHDQPTRQGNILDLVFVSIPSLVKSSVSVPGISDHDIVVTDFDIKPVYSSNKPRKIYLFNKANWEKIKEECTLISGSILSLPLTVDIEEMWNLFKTKILNCIENKVPSRMFKSKNTLHWINHKIKSTL